MSKNVIIYDGVKTNAELSELLRNIANQIDSGLQSGYNPGWEIVEDENE